MTGEAATSVTTSISTYASGMELNSDVGIKRLLEYDNEVSSVLCREKVPEPVSRKPFTGD